MNLTYEGEKSQAFFVCHGLTTILFLTLVLKKKNLTCPAFEPKANRELQK